jgi:hypothetical protein
MPRDLVPSREGPKQEIANEVEKHFRPYTMPKGASTAPKGTVEERRARDFKKAEEHLRILNAASAVEMLQAMPVGLLEMYLLAEEVGQAREFILRAFPKPGRRARERYQPFMDETTAAVTA